ncbi:MAG: hypothetical protein ABL888_00365 [Pirellulaceae bacterium]
MDSIERFSISIGRNGSTSSLSPPGGALVYMMAAKSAAVSAAAMTARPSPSGGNCRRSFEPSRISHEPATGPAWRELTDVSPMRRRVSKSGENAYETSLTLVGPVGRGEGSRKASETSWPAV